VRFNASGLETRNPEPGLFFQQTEDISLRILCGVPIFAMLIDSHSSAVAD
jgi:hypothetical protein